MHIAPVAELVYAQVLGTCAERLGGSSPPGSTLWVMKNGNLRDLNTLLVMLV